MLLVIWLYVCFTIPQYASVPLFSSDMQRKLEEEQQQRKVTEERLLNVEKEKTGYSVDLEQLRNQVQSLQTELRSEADKVFVGFYPSEFLFTFTSLL